MNPIAEEMEPVLPLVAPKPFDHIRAHARIHDAQQSMNIAPTPETTALWCRIWRARRRILRHAENRKSP